MRSANISRKTQETDIKLSLIIDGQGKSVIDTGVGFLDHMLTLFAKHAGCDLEVKCVGDVNVDDHHTTEDIAIVLGQAFSQALGDKRGIVRYGSMILPMDETLILSAIDFSGRAYLGYDLDIPSNKVGTFDTELVEEFWRAFVNNTMCNLHIKQLSGTNSHHIIEGTFKAVARAIRQAASIDALYANEIPSTKGMI